MRTKKKITISLNILYPNYHQDTTKVKGSIITYAIDFNEESLKIAEKDFQKIKITKQQSIIIRELTNFFSKFINISELAMKGILWNSMREWQLKHNKTIAEVWTMPIEKQLYIVKEFISLVKKKLKNMLKDPKEESELLLDVAFEKSFKLYLGYVNKGSN